MSLTSCVGPELQVVSFTLPVSSVLISLSAENDVDSARPRSFAASSLSPHSLAIVGALAVVCVVVVVVIGWGCDVVSSTWCCCVWRGGDRVGGWFMVVFGVRMGSF